jgi:hypothetical protein
VAVAVQGGERGATCLAPRRWAVAAAWGAAPQSNVGLLGEQPKGGEVASGYVPGWSMRAGRRGPGSGPRSSWPPPNERRPRSPWAACPGRAPLSNRAARRPGHGEATWVQPGLASGLAFPLPFPTALKGGPP